MIDDGETTGHDSMGLRLKPFFVGVSAVLIIGITRAIAVQCFSASRFALLCLMDMILS